MSVDSCCFQTVRQWYPEGHSILTAEGKKEKNCQWFSCLSGFVQTHPVIMRISLLLNGNLMLLGGVDASCGMFCIYICWKSTDVTGKIKSEAHSEFWQNSAGNILFLNYMTKRRSTYAAFRGKPAAHQTHYGLCWLWRMWGVCFSICTGFTALLEWLVEIEKKGEKEKMHSCEWLAEFPPLCFHMHSHHWARAQWPIPFPYEILMPEASVNNICSNATFYWLPVRECPIGLALIWKMHICGLVQQ